MQGRRSKMDKTVFLFPGQGSQSVGMGKDFHETYPSVRALFEEASETLSMDFRKLCFEGPEAVLVETENVQPAITLVNASCLEVLKGRGVPPAGAAGHSLGEYSALYAAGVVTFADLMRLVRNRGLFMKDAAGKHPGSMAAVMGLGIETIEDICKDVAESGSVEIANYNSPGQIILSGEKAGLEKAMEEAKTRGAKMVVPLRVSGAWHSRFMEEAKSAMREFLAGIPFQRAAIPVIANATGDYEDDPQSIKENLIRQLTSPVLWVDTIRRFRADGYSAFLEVGPGRVLRGLVKDIDRQADAANVENGRSLEKFLEKEAAK